MHNGVSIKLSEIFIIMLATLGPFKIILPFNYLTKEASYTKIFRVALCTSLISAAIILFTIGYGPFIIEKWGLSIVSISLSCGIILFLQGLFMSFKNPAHMNDFNLPTNADDIADETPLQIAHRLIIPTVITPAGLMSILAVRSIHHADVGVLVIYLFKILALILILNFITMLLTPFICKFIKPIYFRLLIWIFSIFILIFGVHIISLAIKHMFNV